MNRKKLKEAKQRALLWAAARLKDADLEAIFGYIPEDDEVEVLNTARTEAARAIASKVISEL